MWTTLWKLSITKLAHPALTYLHAHRSPGDTHIGCYFGRCMLRHDCHSGNDDHPVFEGITYLNRTPDGSIPRSLPLGDSTDSFLLTSARDRHASSPAVDCAEQYSRLQYLALFSSRGSAQVRVRSFRTMYIGNRSGISWAWVGQLTRS